MLWIALALVCGGGVLVLAVRGEIRERQREIRRAVWPWARAYYALRDGLDDDGPPDTLAGR
jgi:hypothetical protein